ncbi:MBL fold metallo-hydrolase [bacterium]|nr:MBL fold metallo-hydrolase [bacterium]
MPTTEENNKLIEEPTSTTANTPIKSLTHNHAPTYIFALGGVGEIGKNMYVIQHEDEIIIVDAGIKFGNENQPGINGIVPNIDYLKENEKKIKALVITHGHEDHIGAIPHLLKNVKIPEI